MHQLPHTSLPAVLDGAVGVGERVLDGPFGIGDFVVSLYTVVV